MIRAAAQASARLRPPFSSNLFHNLHLCTSLYKSNRTTKQRPPDCISSNTRLGHRPASPATSEPRHRRQIPYRSLRLSVPKDWTNASISNGAGEHASPTERLTAPPDFDRQSAQGRPRERPCISASSKSTNYLIASQHASPLAARWPDSPASISAQRIPPLCCPRCPFGQS